jgi:FHA domain-containing protein/IPT/TIG domain-containing protein
VADPSFKEPAQPILIVTGGPRDGATLVLDVPGAPRLLGTSPECHLRLEGRNVDHHHAHVEWEDRGVMLVDEASTAGTYVNGERVTGERSLSDGDRICLGPPGSPASVKLLVRVPAGLTIPPIAPKHLEPFGDEPELPPIVLDLDDDGPAVPHGGGTGAPQEEEEVFNSEPAPAPASRAARPAEPAGASKADRRRVAADYQEVPSIVTERAREPVAEPREARAPRPAKPPKPAKQKAARRPLTLPKLPRVVWVGLVAFLVVGGGAFGFLQTRRPPPVLKSVTPPKVEPGQTLMVLGTGFDPSVGGNIVRFDKTAGKVTSASDTQITVNAPDGLPTDMVPITVETGGRQSNALLTKVGRMPRADSLEPNVALPGQDVLLRGQNLAGKSLMVTVGGLPVDVRDATATGLRFRVPDLPMVEGRPVMVSVQVGAESARPVTLMLGKLPLVAELAPDNGPPGARVLLRGRGFDASAAGNSVLFGSDPALVLSASETELTVVAPSPSSAESLLRLPVVVRARGGVSSGSRSFTLARRSMGSYVPRFYAAAAGDTPLAFVSSELGPLMLLGGPDDASSTAERAVRVAGALNAALDAAGSSAPRFEVRGGNAIAVAGRPDVLVKVLPADAAAYGQPLDPVMKGQSVTPAALATFWLALLQDLGTLFVDRQRPTRVIELSPRGKVLLDLYSEAERRVGAGNGVPANMVAPIPYALGRSLREMALVVPSRGQAAAGAAVTGKWEGTLEETGAPTRAAQLRLTLEGSKLTGFLSTTAGKLSMDVPIGDVTYERGVLSFTVGGGAVPRRFKGTVSGSAVSGTIHTASNGVEIGKFSLRYAE